MTKWYILAPYTHGWLNGIYDVDACCCCCCIHCAGCHNLLSLYKTEIIVIRYEGMRRFIYNVRHFIVRYSFRVDAKLVLLSLSIHGLWFNLIWLCNYENISRKAYRISHCNKIWIECILKRLKLFLNSICKYIYYSSLLLLFKAVPTPWFNWTCAN